MKNQISIDGNGRNFDGRRNHCCHVFFIVATIVIAVVNVGVVINIATKRLGRPTWQLDVLLAAKN